MSMLFPYIKLRNHLLRHFYLPFAVMHRYFVAHMFTYGLIKGELPHAEPAKPVRLYRHNVFHFMIISLPLRTLRAVSRPFETHILFPRYKMCNKKFIIFRNYRA